MRPAKTSEEGEEQERTQNEPEERKGLEGRGEGWYRGGSRRWVGASQRLIQEPCPPLLRCPGIRFTPNCKAAGLAFVLAFSFAGSMRKGKVGSVGLQVNARPMGYLGDDWWARKHRNSLFHLQAGLQGLGGKLENLSADSSIYLEIRRSIAKQSVKVVMLVGEWEWEPDWGQWSTLWGICN